MNINQTLNLLNNIENDLTWFRQKYETLKEEYNDKFVAIENGKIISADKDIREVIKKLKDKKKDPSKILVKFVSKIPVIL